MNETPERRDEAVEETPKKPAADQKRSAVHRMFLVAAGGYIVWLGIQLAMGLYRGEINETERFYILIWVAMVVFIAFGAFIMVWHIRAAIQDFRESVLAMDDYEDDKPDEDEDDEEEEPLAIEPPDGEDEE